MVATACVLVGAAVTWFALGGSESRPQAPSNALPTGTNGPPLAENVASLQAACEANGDDPSSWCAAYLRAAFESFQAFGAGGHKAGTCAPAPPQPDELNRRFVSWSKSHAEAGPYPMMAGVNLAFRTAWPCS